MSTDHLVIVGLPRSANVYIGLATAETLGCERFVFCSRGFMVQRVLPDALHQFFTVPRAVGGQHLTASPFDLNLLHIFGVSRIAVLVRDPRDAVVSWFHHLESEEVKAVPWHDAAMVAAGLQRPDYRSLGPSQKMDDLLDKTYPAMQSWLLGWSTTIGKDKRFDFHILRYEDFIQNPAATLGSLFRFFGHHVRPVLPSIRRFPHQTHFRRGITGSHREELSASQLADVHERTDLQLFQSFGWKV